VDGACDFDTDVVAAYGAVLTGDRAAARARLDAAEADLACAPVSAQALGRFWLVEAAYLASTGDPDATLSLVAARRVAPDLWLPELGEPLKERWTAATPDAGAGSIAFDVPPAHRAVTLDGAAWTWTGAPIPAGLHAVQVAEGGTIRYGAVVYVGDGASTRLTTGLPDAPPPPIPVPRGRAPELLPFVLATGASLSVGRSLTASSGSATLTEPAAKLVVPIEASGGVAMGGGFVRAELGSGWLVGGPYLSAKADGTLHRTPLRFDAALGGGAALGDRWVGGAGGVQWPGRLTARAFAGTTLDDLGDSELRGWAEARAGVNAATARRIEPGVELLVGVGY
jgi:hypothetical protein